MAAFAVQHQDEKRPKEACESGRTVDEVSGKIPKTEKDQHRQDAVKSHEADERNQRIFQGSQQNLQAENRIAAEKFIICVQKQKIFDNEPQC